MLCHTLTMMSVNFAMDGWRPNSLGFIDSTTHPIRCHWKYADNEKDCANILASAEEAWDAQVTDMGFEAPTPDTDGILDFYIADDWTKGGAWTACNDMRDSDSGDGRRSCPAYVVMDPHYSGKKLRATVVHEFNHVVQFSHDFMEPSYLIWEGMASAAEPWTSNRYQTYISYVQAFQDDPWLGLLGDSYYLWDAHRIWSYYEYGGAVWALHMDDVWGGAVDGEAGADLWWAASEESAGTENEPDIMDAYDTVTGDWQVALLDLAQARARIGTEHAPAWATFTQDVPDSYADGTIAYEAHVEWADLPVTITPEFMPFETGMVYVQIGSVPEDAAVKVRLKGDEGVTWGAFSVDGADGDWAIANTLTQNGSGGDVMMGAVNLGPPEFDADPGGFGTFPGNNLQAWDVLLEFEQAERVEDTTTGTTGGSTTGGSTTGGSTSGGSTTGGTTGATGGATSGGTSGGSGGDDTGRPPLKDDTEEPTGCGCASGPTGGLSWIAVTALAAALRRRRDTASHQA